MKMIGLVSDLWCRTIKSWLLTIYIRYLDEILIALTRNMLIADGKSNAHNLMLMIESFQIELFINDGRSNVTIDLLHRTKQNS